MSFIWPLSLNGQGKGQVSTICVWAENVKALFSTADLNLLQCIYLRYLHKPQSQLNIYLSDRKKMIKTNLEC